MCLWVCPSVRKVTHERVDGCQPNLAGVARQRWLSRNNSILWWSLNDRPMIHDFMTLGLSLNIMVMVRVRIVFRDRVSASTALNHGSSETETQILVLSWSGCRSRIICHFPSQYEIGHFICSCAGLCPAIGRSLIYSVLFSFWDTETWTRTYCWFIWSLHGLSGMGGQAELLLKTFKL